jgi:phage terminase large subunit-like protein
MATKEDVGYDQVGRDIVELCNYFKTQCIAYDPHRAGSIIEDYLMPAGLTCMPHRQGAITMSPAAMKFENLVKRRSVAHGNHPLLDAAV